VLELQQQLNALGAKPPLALDGKLGPKTEAAMKALLGANPPPSASSAPPAATDDFQTPAPAPMPPLTTQVAQTTPVTPAPSSGGVAGKVVDQALAENDTINPFKRGEDGKVKGWQQLQSVFEQTTGWKPSDAECQHVIPGSGLKPGGKSWCGIWATHIFQEAGVNVKWDLTKGKMVGDVTQTLAPRFTSPAQYKAERQAFEQSVKPGDVITVNGASNHHAIVTQVNPDGTVETMDGNKPQVGPGHQKLSDVTSFYRPNQA
jgi:peptidoglycan hydrolase-like protein with peptidoglycan-binding domain